MEYAHGDMIVDKGHILIYNHFDDVFWSATAFHKRLKERGVKEHFDRFTYTLSICDNRPKSTFNYFLT